MRVTIWGQHVAGLEQLFKNDSDQLLIVILASIRAISTNGETILIIVYSVNA